MTKTVFTPKRVENEEEAKKVSEFLASNNAFDFELGTGDIEQINEDPIKSIGSQDRAFWYVSDEKGNVVAAGGVSPNEMKSGGYYLTYYAVHKKHRRKGLGSMTLKAAEEFVMSTLGRYLMIDTGETEAFLPARKLYEKLGYVPVGYIPDYYEKGKGRIDYIKYLTQDAQRIYQSLLSSNPLSSKDQQMFNQLEQAQAQAARAVADYQNLERRMQQEKQEWIKYANTNLLTKILEVADNLDRAADFIKDPGLDMVRGSFKNVLKEFGVEEIEALGEPYDPHQMECVDKKDGEENMVVEVAAKGYRLHDKVLRPAKVIVGIGQASD